MSNVDTIIDSLREKGLNVTYQRLLIYKHLLNSKNHPTAEEIYRSVKGEYPSISLATVYKTLETLSEHNLITKVSALHDLARFDGDTDLHHHLVCLNCKTIVDIYDEALNNLPVPSSNGFQVHGHRVLFEGVCEKCHSGNTLGHPSVEPGNEVTFCGKQ